MESESGEESREHGVFSTRDIVAAVLVGLLLIWIGYLVMIVPEWEDSDAVNTAYKTAMILISLGGVISSGALVGGGLINRGIDKFVRLGMLIAAALIIVQVMSWGMTLPAWRFL